MNSSGFRVRAKGASRNDVALFDHLIGAGQPAWRGCRGRWLWRSCVDQALRRFSAGLLRLRFLPEVAFAARGGAAALKMPLILVCQPGPDSRNLASTSASMRSFTACFGCSARGRPPLLRNCAITSAGKTSDAGFAFAKSRAVHSGFSSCRSGSNFGLVAISPVLSSVSLAQADGADIGAAKRKDEAVHRVVDQAERDVPRFTIIETIILTNDRCRHVDFFGSCQRNAMFANVASFFVRIEGNAHDVFVPPKTC